MSIAAETIFRLRPARLLHVIGVALALSPAVLVAGDDTFADLARPGPVIRITGNQAYKTYTLMSWQDGTKIDARGARWSSFSWGRDIRHATVNETTRNDYPILLGADWFGAYPVRQDLYNDGRCPPPRTELVRIANGE